MADTEAARKREERRRKITQNAEARMNRLLGKSNEPDSSSVKSSPCPTVEVLQSAGENMPSDSNVSSSPYNLRQRPVRSPNSNKQESTLLSELNINEGFAHSSQTNSHPSPIQESIHPTGSRLSTESQNAEECNTTIGGKAVFQQDTPLQTRELVHMSCCIITALMTKIMLMYGFQAWCFQTIILPFIVMELTLVYLSRTVLKHLGQPEAPGTMWSAALMLCGIKQELIDFYSSTMAQVMASKNNLCFYLFSFLVVHTLLG